MAAQQEIKYYYNTPYPPSFQPQQSNVLSSQPPRRPDFTRHHPQPNDAIISSTPGLYTTIIQPSPNIAPREEESADDSEDTIVNDDKVSFQSNSEWNKRKRRNWTHKWEKLLFSEEEIRDAHGLILNRSSLPAPQRRPIYICSLEAHIDHLHAQLEQLGIWPAPPEDVLQCSGMNSKSAKSAIGTLSFDISSLDKSIQDIEIKNKNLEKVLGELYYLPMQ
ncbi:hypothetical protein CVT26_002401 [Gymnopilus dilepis]|uniref:Uncharacterized protein n=1 Tax=Gymnopilus dilepis TaxID=231916 RepID=A0A409Y3N5_9AGAR|nr:hypothetical protein CVT26_002401 [Gymnopilus dilepis]